MVTTDLGRIAKAEIQLILASLDNGNMSEEIVLDVPADWSQYADRVGQSGRDDSDGLGEIAELMQAYANKHNLGITVTLHGKDHQYYWRITARAFV